MSLTAIGVGMAALAVIGGGLGIGFATSSAVKAIAQQPEAHGKIRSTLLIGAALAEAINKVLRICIRYFNHLNGEIGGIIYVKN